MACDERGTRHDMMTAVSWELGTAAASMSPTDAYHGRPPKLSAAVILSSRLTPSGWLVSHGSTMGVYCA